MNLATLAARRQTAADRIADAVQILTEHTDMADEAEALASIQNPDPQVKELLTLEALAAILEKAGQIEGGAAGVEPTYRITQSERDELEELREERTMRLNALRGMRGAELVGASGPEQFVPGTEGRVIPPSEAVFTGGVLDDAILYRLGEEHPADYVVPTALLASIDGAAQPIVIADLHPERVRMAASILRDLMSEQAAFALSLGEPADTGDEAPQTDAPGPGRPGAPLADAEGPEAVFTARQREGLTESGLDTPDKIAAASDEQLLAVPGIAEATVAKYREAQGETLPEGTPPPPPNPPTAPNPEAGPPPEPGPKSAADEPKPPAEGKA